MKINRSVFGSMKNIAAGYLAIISGLLMLLSFPPLPFSFLAYFGLLPIIYSFDKSDFRLGFSKGFLFGLTLNTGILYWLVVNKGTTWYFGIISMIGGVLFLAVLYGILGSIIGCLGNKLDWKKALWGLPFLYTGFEFLSAKGTLGFTWNNLFYTQANSVLPSQIASIFGGYGITFWLVLVNVLIYISIKKFVKKERVKIYSLVTFTVLILPFIFGYLKIQSNVSSEQSVEIGVVQPNVDPNAKWATNNYRKNMNKLYSLSDSVAENKNLDLLVWPETAVPAYLRHQKETEKAIKDHAKKLETCLLTGAPDYVSKENNEGKFYNTTFLINPQKMNLEFYRKIRLVPFGERIPLSSVFEELKNLNLGQGNYNSGDSLKVFQIPVSDTNTVAFSTAICYESGFSDLIRKNKEKGAEFLVVVTNDAWFGNTSAPYLHAAISRIRAIENAFPVVRSANTGISMIIDKFGRVEKRIGWDEKSWIRKTIEINNHKTIYNRIGYIFTWLSLAISGGFIITAILNKNL